jgi:hypothetical protein
LSRTLPVAVIGEERYSVRGRGLAPEDYGVKDIRRILPGGGMGESHPDTVDAAVGGGEDFKAKAVLFDNLAAHRDVAGDLGDEAAEGGGLVVLGQAERGGLVVISLGVVVGVAEDALWASVGVFGVGAGAGVGV